MQRTMIILSLIATMVVAPATPGQTWSEKGDAGQNNIGEAQIIAGSGPLTSISGSIGADNDVDLYKIFITDEASFSASTVGGSTIDTQLFLFTDTGLGQVHNDDFAGTLQSTITSQGLFANGTYYLAISAYDADPEDGGGNFIFYPLTLLYPGPDPQQRMPDPTAGALAQWTGSTAHHLYTITLTGAEFFPEFQVNQPGCSHDYNGVIGGGAKPALVNVAPGGILTSTLTGIGFFESVVTGGPCVPRSLQSAPLLTPTQTVNLDFPGSLLFFFNGAVAGTPLVPVLQPVGAGQSFSFAVPQVCPLTASQQCVTVDATFPEGACLSQASEVSLPGAQATQPIGFTEIDQSILLDVSASPITFCGTIYTQIYANDHGNVTFGAGDVFWQCNMGTASALPRLAWHWGNITVFGEPTASADYGLVNGVWIFSYRNLGESGNGIGGDAGADVWFDTCSDACGISNYSPEPPYPSFCYAGLTRGPGSTNQFGSTGPFPNGIAVSFSGAAGSGLQVSALPTDEVYDYSSSGSLLGFSSVTFPNGDGSTWFSN